MSTSITAHASSITSVASGAGGCDDTFSSIFTQYCAQILTAEPTCTEDTAACCTAEYKFASSLYGCVSSHAGPCAATISAYISDFNSALSDCTSFVATASGTGHTASASKSAGTAKTTSSGTAVATGEITAAQSSSTSTTTAKSGSVKVETSLRTPVVIALAGGVAMFFLGAML